jgi:hypothetical protein
MRGLKKELSLCFRLMWKQQYGATALTFAKDKHRVETIRLLEEAGAR